MTLADNPLIKPHLGKPAILDSNLLLLHCCASFDRQLVQTFKRLNSFEGRDVALLAETLSLFPVLRTTPHVLTEVSNLANSLPEWRRDAWVDHFTRTIHIASEEWLPAKSIASGSAMWLGLTDAALHSLASTHVIITMDWPLSNTLETQRLNVINFTNLRTASLE